MKQSNIMKNHETSSNIIKNHQTSSKIIKHHQKSSNIIKNHQNHQTSSNIIKNHQKSSNIKNHQTSSNIIKNPIFHPKNPRLFRSLAASIFPHPGPARSFDGPLHLPELWDLTMACFHRAPIAGRFKTWKIHGKIHL